VRAAAENFFAESAQVSHPASICGVKGNPKLPAKSQHQTHLRSMKTTTTLRSFFKSALLLASLSLMVPDTASAFGNVIEPTTPTPGIGSPNRGPVGSVIELSGIAYDKDKDGNTWRGTPPYQIKFQGVGATTLVNATFTVLSPSKLRVTVPAGAVSGSIRLVQGTYSKSSILSFTVEVPIAAGTLRIQNSSQYNLISVKVNNVETLNPGLGVPVGTFMNLPRQPGTYSVSVVMGITTDAPLFFFNGSATVRSNTTATFTTPRVTVAQLMTNFSAQKDWSSDILLGSDNRFYIRTIRFNSKGQYQIFDSSVANAVESGNYSQITWANNSSSVTFRLGVRTVTISLPFGSFFGNADRGNRTTLFTRQ